MWSRSSFRSGETESSIYILTLAFIIQFAEYTVLTQMPAIDPKDPPFLLPQGLLRVLRQRKAVDFDGLDLRPLVGPSFANVVDMTGST